MSKSIFTLTRTLAIAAVMAILTGCSSLATASLSTKTTTPTQISKQVQRAITQSRNNDATKILSTYRNWAGTRYRLGGSSKTGIDCSAFVQKTMSSAFKLHLPRTTSEQKHLGKAIAKSELRPGDLVFFRKNHHVGVYIGGGKFVHASSSRGVTTSSLSESYWARTYTQSRRVL